MRRPATLPERRALHRVRVRRRTKTGYQALDLQITKDFEIGDLGSMYLRIDVLNVTNEHNLVDFIDAESGRTDSSSAGVTTPFGNITGVPRTVRMSFGVKF